MRLTSLARGTFAALVDLVLPADCAGCGGPAGAGGVCDTCAGALAQPPFATRPNPVPDGLPPCYAAGRYEGPLRELILAYKEHGRRGLATPLGRALAAAVHAGRPPGVPVLVPVPSTPAAVRARQGDHMLRLARTVAAQLRAGGVPAVVARPLRALPRQDSAQLDRQRRAVAARSAFAVRPAMVADLSRSAGVVLLDDVLTTGATLAAVATRLRAAGVAVGFAATVAATQLRREQVGSDSPVTPIERIPSDGYWDGGDGAPRRS